MDENRLLQYARPMPEAYDAQEPAVLPYLRAFGAGLVDPGGFPSWLMNLAATHPEGPLEGYYKQYPHRRDDIGGFTDWYQRRMQELRDESPSAAGAGSAVVPGLIAGPLVGGPMLGAGSVTEALTVVPPVVGIGGALGRMRGAANPPQQKKRPQGAYPPDGAY